MCTRQSRKVLLDMFNTLFLTPQMSLLLLSFSTRRHMSTASSAILSNFSEKQRTQNHLQYLSGLARALYPTTFLEIAVSRHNSFIKVTRPSFLGGYHPTLKLSGIPTFTFIVSLTHRMDNIQINLQYNKIFGDRSKCHVVIMPRPFEV